MNRYSFKVMPLVALLVLVGAACSSSEGGSGGITTISGSPGTSKGGANNGSGSGGTTSSSAGGSTNGALGGSTSSTSRGGSTSTAGQASACMGVVGGDDPTAGTCTGIQQEAERIPIDMFIMMDRSCSMNYCLGSSGENCSTVPDCTASGGSRWDAIRAGLVDFVTKVGNKDMRAGIGFFGASISGGVDAVDCDVTQYSTPKVAMAPMTQAGPAIIAAIDATQPGGLTPTYPALDGALRYAKQWAASNVGRQTVVVLVTDGYPTQCQDPISIAAIARLSAAAYTTEPSVRTYVVGLAAGFNLDTIAQSGGSNTAFNFDKSSVTADNLATTLLNITNSKVACNYEIPPAPSGQVFNPTKVQVIYTPSSGPTQEVPKIENGSACDRNPNGGWFYDNEANPTTIQVCPCSCANLQAGTVSVNIGCDPYVGIK